MPMQRKRYGLKNNEGKDGDTQEAIQGPKV
jgi:hypothetical protein